MRLLTELQFCPTSSKSKIRMCRVLAIHSNFCFNENFLYLIFITKERFNRLEKIFRHYQPF